MAVFFASKSMIYNERGKLISSRFNKMMPHQAQVIKQTPYLA